MPNTAHAFSRREKSPIQNVWFESLTGLRRESMLDSVRFLNHFSRLMQRRRSQASAMESKWCGLAELVEGHSRTSMAAQTLALSTAAGMSSWDEIARAAIDYGDENFAGEVVGFVEQRLRQMS
jgi:hypothetical protein